MKDTKTIVKEKYGKIAGQTKNINETSCCGAGKCDSIDYVIFADDYSKLQGYNQDADLGLGCGLPTEFAKIQKGDTVVDLGSGAGNDCFVARSETGESGRVIGIDFTEEMINKARQNSEKLGYKNVEFLFGDIENIPLPAEIADVVVSNCVLNLVPDKNKAFAEIFRILKDGGHFSISDVVIEGTLPKKLQEDAEMYAGCVAGATKKDDYLKIIEDSGFKNITIEKRKPITIPGELLEKYLPKEQVANFNSTAGIFSITVYGEKPLK